MSEWVSWWLSESAREAYSLTHKSRSEWFSKRSLGPSSYKPKWYLANIYNTLCVQSARNASTNQLNINKCLKPKTKKKKQQQNNTLYRNPQYIHTQLHIEYAWFLVYIRQSFCYIITSWMSYPTSRTATTTTAVSALLGARYYSHSFDSSAIAWRLFRLSTLHIQTRRAVPLLSIINECGLHWRSHKIEEKKKKKRKTATT